MTFDEQLFQKNIKMFSEVFADRMSEIDINQARLLRDQATFNPDKPEWNPSKEGNVFITPTYWIKDSQHISELQSLCRRYPLASGIESYLKAPDADTHLMHGLVDLYQAVEKSGFDTSQNYVTTESFKPFFLVAYGTGSGEELQILINRYSPEHLFLAVPEWNAFVSSFWTIDWQHMWKRYSHERNRILIGKYATPSSIVSSLCDIAIGGIDYSILYMPTNIIPDSQNFRKELTDNIPKSAISYLGFPLDEHNMVWHSWHSLQKQPRIFVQPLNPLGGNYVVCGSGPSLDGLIETIRQLQHTHTIICSGSNYRTLRKAGIEVDLLVLLERTVDMIEDYRKIAIDFGTGSTKLLASVTCPSELHNFFEDTMVYFRPALTPLAVFADSPREILNFEGPQSINTGVAFAVALGANNIVLAGVDLGVKSLDVVRSRDAAGVSPRKFSIEVEANFGGKCLTEQFLLDAKTALENCIKSSPSIRVYNISDGIKINGAEMIDPSQYLSLQDSLACVESSDWKDWWFGQLRYSSQRFDSLWRSRRPRVATAKFFTELRNLINSDNAWSPVVIEQINRLLRLDVSPADQFPRRLFRSTIHRLVLTITRQIRVMASNPSAQYDFEKHARFILTDLLTKYEQETYQLTDYLEQPDQAK